MRRSILEHALCATRTKTPVTRTIKGGFIHVTLYSKKTQILLCNIPDLSHLLSN
jgi:hypothetical protein